MASPFTIFRRHQKTMIAALAILAMIAFVFMDPTILDSFGIRSDNRNPVVVKTSRFGSLHQSELDGLRRQRQFVLNFLQRAYEAVRTAGGSGETIEAIRGALGAEPTSDQSLVDTWLFAEQAQRLGMVISDKSINEFLREVTQNKVSSHDLRTIVDHMNVGQRYLFEALRRELLALRLRGIFRVSLAGTTPNQRWDYFCRLKRTATIEVLPVPVADFLDQVANPDEKTLQAFFEQYKDKYASATSAEPGFREPKRIALRYFKAEQEKLLAPGAVTEEEILRQYEKDKERYDQLLGGVPLVAPPKKEPPEAEKTPPTEKAPSSEKTPAEEKPSIEEKKPEKPADQEKDPKDTSSAPVASPFRLVSLVGEPADAEGAQQSETPGAKEEEKQPAEKASEKPGEKSEKGGEKPSEKGEKADEKPSEKGVKAGEKLVEPTPLPPRERDEILRDRVREIIRRDVASAKLEKTFRDLEGDLRAFRTKWSKYEAAVVQKREATPPEKPDYEALARPYGLTTDQTPLLSQAEMQTTDIGRSFVSTGALLVQYAYESSLPLYLPANSMDLSGNLYLFCKVAETEDKIPKFTGEGVREQVLHTWKMIEAHKKARQQADLLAEEARKAKKPLEEVFAGRPKIEVEKPPAFSWMTYGSVPASASRTPPRLSEVEGVRYPGDDFMRAVFNLPRGGVGVAMNQPRTIAYVVYLGDVTPPDSVLWAQFEVDSYDKYQNAAIYDQQQAVEAWLSELKASAHLQWERRPDRPREEPATE